MKRISIAERCEVFNCKRTESEGSNETRGQKVLCGFWEKIQNSQISFVLRKSFFGAELTVATFHEEEKEPKLTALILDNKKSRTTL